MIRRSAALVLSMAALVMTVAASDAATLKPYEQAADFWANAEETWELTSDREMTLQFFNPYYITGIEDDAGNPSVYNEWTAEQLAEFTDIFSGLRRLTPEESALVTELRCDVNGKTATISLSRTFARSYDLIIGVNVAVGRVTYRVVGSEVAFQGIEVYACAPDTLERLMTAADR